MGRPTPLDFLQRHMNRLDVPAFYQFEFFQNAIRRIDNKEGIYIEFGLFVGNTAKQIIQLIPTNKLLYGFESLQGMEDDTTPEALKGINACIGEIEYPPQIRLVLGRLQDTLHGFLGNHPGYISFIHIDVSWSCIEWALNKLCEEHRLKKGMVICIAHAIKELDGVVYDKNYQAFLRVVNKYNIKYDIIGFGDVHMAIKITENV